MGRTLVLGKEVTVRQALAPVETGLLPSWKLLIKHKNTLLSLPLRVTPHGLSSVTVSSVLET